MLLEMDKYPRSLFQSNIVDWLESSTIFHDRIDINKSWVFSTDNMKILVQIAILLMAESFWTQSETM